MSAPPLASSLAATPPAEIAERRGWTYTKVNKCLNEGRVALRRAGALLTAAAP